MPHQIEQPNPFNQCVAPDKSQTDFRLSLKIHLSSLANLVGIILIYIYYRFMNPDPQVVQVWSSSRLINVSFFLLSAVPFLVIGAFMRSQNTRAARTFQKGKENLKGVSKRDFSAQMPVLTDDEIGYVSGGLNQMVEELSSLYQSLEKR